MLCHQGVDVLLEMPMANIFGGLPWCKVSLRGGPSGGMI